MKRNLVPIKTRQMVSNKNEWKIKSVNELKKER